MPLQGVILLHRFVTDEILVALIAEDNILV